MLRNDRVDDHPRVWLYVTGLASLGGFARMINKCPFQRHENLTRNSENAMKTRPFQNAPLINLDIFPSSEAR